MSGDPFTRWRLTPVINASGTMTGIGASRVAPGTRSPVDAILGAFVDMDELQARAGGIIARLTGAESGCVTACSAAAITQAVAAMITGDDLAAIEALPDCGGAERRTILQMGHSINYGAPIEQAIRLAGAEAVHVGTAAQCETHHLRRALAAGAAAALYIVSHHTVREGELPMDVFIGLCREHGVPVIVDMASEYDLRGPIALGADVVIHSGHKFLGGVTSGVVAGRRDVIRAIYLQHRGIGRTMKVGKEGVVGAMAALEAWEGRDHDTTRQCEDEIVEGWLAALDDLPGLALERHRDWTGNPIVRVRVAVDPDAAGLFAWELADRLAMRRPRIIVRDDLVEHGEFYLDPCNVTGEEAVAVSEAICEEVAAVRERGDGRRRSWSDVKRAREADVLAWPDDEDDVA